MAEMDAERSAAEAREAASQFEADGLRARAQAEARRRLLAEQKAFLDVQNAAKADLEGARSSGAGLRSRVALCLPVLMRSRVSGAHAAPRPPAPPQLASGSTRWP